VILKIWQPPLPGPWWESVVALHFVVVGSMKRVCGIVVLLVVLSSLVEAKGAGKFSYAGVAASENLKEGIVSPPPGLGPPLF
jgi:hypothetical protein